MTEYRRLPPLGATYFFTVRLDRCGATLLTDHIDALRYAYAKAVQEYPVICHAMVVLPDHMHAVWTEPAGGVWYPERWRRIKARFAHAVADPVQPGAAVRREGGVWQRRFQERALQSEDAYRQAIEQCRMNPVKHGLVAEAGQWPYSSFAKGRQPHKAAAPNVMAMA